MAAIPPNGLTVADAAALAACSAAAAVAAPDSPVVGLAATPDGGGNWSKSSCK